MKIKKIIGSLSMSSVLFTVMCLPMAAQSMPVGWAIDAPYMKKPISGTFHYQSNPDLLESIQSGEKKPGIIELFAKAIGRSSLLMTTGLNARGRMSIQDLPIKFTLPVPRTPGGERGIVPPSPKGGPGGDAAAIPLPATLSLLVLGLAGLFAVSRRQSVRPS